MAQRRRPSQWPPAATSSGGRGWRRVCLLLALICCSPVLIPLACVSFPLVCIASGCLPARRQGMPKRPGAEESGVVRRCQEAEGRLLQRYLEDQLGLVGDGGSLSSDGGDWGDQLGLHD